MDGVTGAVEDATEAINRSADAADAGFAGLPRRMEEVMAQSDAYVGVVYRQRDAVEEQTEAVEELTREEMILRREQRRTGEFQKQRHLERLREVRSEILTHQESLELSLAEAQAEQSSLAYRGSRYRSLQSTINRLRTELETATNVLRTFDLQIDRVSDADAAVFMDETAAATSRTTTAVAKGSASWREYQTDLEKLEETLTDITSAQAALVQQLRQAEEAASNAVANDDGSDEAFARIEQTAAALEAIRQEFSAQTGASRGAVAALIDYARATEEVADAVARLESMGSVITAADAALAMGELRKMADELTSGILVGEDAIESDFQERLDSIQRARAAAAATGVQDLTAYDRALDAAYQDRAEALATLAKELSPSITDLFGTPDLSYLQGDFAEFEIAGERFREIMRESVKNAMREGIQTDDWGTAFRGILADAVVSALDDSLDRLGDFLADFFLGANGQQGLLGFLGRSFSFGGGRAGGGPMHRNSWYNVNEQGAGEVLFLGKTAGEMLNAQQFREAVGGAGRGAGPVTIHSPLIVQGSIDHATKTDVLAAIQKNNMQIMQQIPGAVDARVNESIVHRRLRR